MFQRTSDSRHYPFELPSGWVLTSIGELLINRDGERKPVSSVIRKKQTNKIYNYYGAAGVIDKVDNYLFDEKSLLISEDGANLLSRNKNNAFFAEGKYWVNNHAHVIDSTNKNLLDYVAFVINSMSLDNYITGSAQPKLTQENLNRIPIMLPPLNEQSRIILEIKRWFQLIDNIEQCKTTLQEVLLQAKNKILDLAIHGKLVPQDPADEPAIKLLNRVNPSAEITCDNEQYWNMPNGWCVCRIKDLFKICMGQSPAGTSLNQIEGMEFHQGKICFTDKFLDKSKILTNRPTKIADANSLLICVRAPVGVLNINTRQICIGRGLCALLPSKCVDLGFAFHCLTTYQQRFEQKSTGSTFKAISGDIIKNELFPLPPLAEQQRIVAKIEELFAQLDAIENSLQA